MERSDRLKQLADYAGGPQRVKDFVGSVPKEAHSFRPNMEDAWTMGEHVQHLFDAETRGYTRYRTAIVTPGSAITLWDQEAWRARLGYDKHDLSTALEAFAVIRKIVHHHLTMIVEDDWSGYTFIHPERGSLDLDDWLTIYSGHVGFHIEYLERNLRLFKEQG